MKYSEATLDNWRKPPSDTEEGKLSNAEKLIREAISNNLILKDKDITVFGQGSYANDTNVRLNSDTDINVRYNGSFFYDIPSGKEAADYGLNNPSTYDYADFRKDVESALVEKFGRSEVINNNKCLTVRATATRVEADVVPTFCYRRYDDPNSEHYVVGVKFIPRDDIFPIANFPLQHIENGKTKNANTQKRFKRLTRIFRRIRYKMIDDGILVSDNITSFLLECLIWNVPNHILNNNDTWTKRLRESIVFLYDKTKTDDACKEWGEVSELLYLFRGNHKWTIAEVNQFLVQMWNYLEFE